MPTGEFREVATSWLWVLGGGLGIVLEVKLFWPSTRSAVGCDVLGASWLEGKRRTRLLPESVTHKLPVAGSTAMPVRPAWSPCRFRVWAVGSCRPWLVWVPDAMEGWPMTRSTVRRAPVCLKGAGKRRMRLLPMSATYRFPLLSTAIEVGVEKPAVRPP